MSVFWPSLRGYDLIRPRLWRGGVIVTSPHSGRVFPAAFLHQSRLSPEVLRSSEDAYVDWLIAPAADFAVILSAQISRAVVDLNRAGDEFDPAVVSGLPKGRRASARALAGLGVIPRVVAGGQVIRRAPLSYDEAQQIIDAYWRPYHQALAAVIAEARDRFGRALVIDMHSMPRAALAHVAPRPDVVLGNLFGTSARADTMQALAAVFAREGFTTAQNRPFAGAYTVQNYGRPARGVEVVQVEIDRSLYLDEGRIAPRADIDGFAARLGRVMAALAGIGV